MTAWVAVWQRSSVYWELLVTDEAGNVASTEPTHAPFISPHPADRVLVSMGLCPAGEWERDEWDGSWRCPVIATKARENELQTGLLARQRSDPGTRVH